MCAGTGFGRKAPRTLHLPQSHVCVSDGHMQFEEQVQPVLHVACNQPQEERDGRGCVVQHRVDGPRHMIWPPTLSAAELWPLTLHFPASHAPPDGHVQLPSQDFPQMGCVWAEQTSFATAGKAQGPA